MSSEIPGVKLQPGMRADAATRLVLQNLLESMQLNEQGVLQGIDIDFLHDFRVAVRRTRSILGEMKKVFPPATWRRFRREFAWLGKLTGSARDLDVYLFNFDRYKTALPKKMRADIEPVRVFLQRKKQQEQARKITVQLQSTRYRKLNEQWARYLSSPLAKRPMASDATKTIDVVARNQTWRAYKRVYREAQAITAESPNVDLHELRKSCKNLRYLMEFFQSLYVPDTIKALIVELKHLQDCLGVFQDLTVQAVILEDCLKQMKKTGMNSDATGKAIGLLLKTFQEQMADVRSEVEAKIELFIRMENQRMFKLITTQTTE